MRRTSDVEIATLDNGLRVVCRRAPGALVEYCGAVVRVGSRDDAPDQPGMAHFVEHTIFKGTERRSSWHILNRMERVGGELNAYTTKEETVVYTAAPAGNLDRSLDLVGDLLSSSRFPDAELDKEREVVEEEIKSYLDSPSEAVFDDFEDMVFAGTPLGHNILGNADALAKFDSEKCRAYLYNWYTTRNAVVFYQGPSSASRVAQLVSRRFALPEHEPERQPRIEPSALPPVQTLERNIDTHQAHTVMGAVIEGMYSPDRYAMALLTNVLGGPGMNSRLNVQLRERRGLVYSVEASSSFLTDCGLFTVYFGCEPDQTQRCIGLVRRQIAELATTPLSERALGMAKKQYLGQLAVASDNRDSMAINTGRAVLCYGQVATEQQTADRINAITAEQLRQAAERVSRLSILTLS